VQLEVNNLMQIVDLRIAVVLGVLVFLYVVVLIVGRLRQPVVYIEAVDTLLTPAEQKFYQALDRAVDGRYAILAKVRVADILKVSSQNNSARHRLFMSIACKHVDFVLADAEDLHPVAAIELDDSSHQRADRIKRDALLNNLFKKAELPLIRFPTAPVYDLGAIEECIFDQTMR
jgi:uncharacterized protein DUF2726